MQSGTCNKKNYNSTLVIHNFLLYCKYNVNLCNLQVQNCIFLAAGSQLRVNDFYKQKLPETNNNNLGKTFFLFLRGVCFLPN
jgi:hypothetical protein